MKISLNLYQDTSYTAEIVREAVNNKDPLVFIVPDSYKNSNVFAFIKEVEDMQKSVCVLDTCNTARVLAYLITFPDIRKRHVVFSSPKDFKSQTKSMIIEVNNLMSQIKPVDEDEIEKKDKPKLKITKTK